MHNRERSKHIYNQYSLREKRSSGKKKTILLEIQIRTFKLKKELKGKVEGIIQKGEHKVCRK